MLHFSHPLPFNEKKKNKVSEIGSVSVIRYKPLDANTSLIKKSVDFPISNTGYVTSRGTMIILKWEAR
jgi:hypothetical protein